MVSIARVVAVALVAAACLIVAGCRLVRLSRAPACGAALPKSARADLAIVRPQYDRRIGGFIEKLDGVDVGRYLRGWGVRPKLPEIGVDPGIHTFEVGYYDFRAHAFSPGTSTVRFAAEAGHLYHIRIEQRSFFSKVGTLLGGRTTTWGASVNDAGCVEQPVPIPAPTAQPRPADPRRHRKRSRPRRS